MATRTAAQKRAQAKADYDAFLAACPSRKLLDRISDKWVTLIVAALGSDGSHRFSADCAGERIGFLSVVNGARSETSLLFGFHSY